MPPVLDVRCPRAVERATIRFVPLLGLRIRESAGSSACGLRIEIGFGKRTTSSGRGRVDRPGVPGGHPVISRPAGTGGPRRIVRHPFPLPATAVPKSQSRSPGSLRHVSHIRIDHFRAFGPGDPGPSRVGRGKTGDRTRILFSAGIPAHGGPRWAQRDLNPRPPACKAGALTS